MRSATGGWCCAAAVIGTYVGMLPGLGGAVVDWFAYGHAVQTRQGQVAFWAGRHPRRDLRPRPPTTRAKGGSLIPTVAFGIPGSLGAAILMGALLIKGLRPGPDMLTDQLRLTFRMVWTHRRSPTDRGRDPADGFATQVAKVSFVPGHLIVPAVVLFVFMGAWLGGWHHRRLGQLLRVRHGRLRHEAGWLAAPAAGPGVDSRAAARECVRHQHAHLRWAVLAGTPHCRGDFDYRGANLVLFGSWDHPSETER